MSEPVEYGDWFITDAPKTLDEIYGQDNVVKYFKKQQMSRKFDKSTLFTGQFGSGKTAFAKILAKTIACSNPNEDGSPCNKCPTCMSVNEEKFNKDVLHIDAEEMGAADIRDLVKKFTEAPAWNGTAKVIICDEAQALSKEAVEAFLNVTQSPRKGFFFIFTAMDKLKGGKAGAVLSRCKVHKMNVPTNEQVYMYLAGICKAKGIVNDPNVPKEFFGEGLAFIAENSEASYRKAIQQLQQCYVEEAFTKEDMKKTLDIVSYDDAALLMIDIAHGRNTKEVWDALNGADYQDKFPLFLNTVGDAMSVRAFGLEHVDPQDRWKWNQAKTLAIAPYFDDLANAFMELSNKAYLKRGEWKLVIAKTFIDITRKIKFSDNKKEHLTEQSEAPSRGSRSKV